MKKLFLSLFLTLVLVGQGAFAQKSTDLTEKLPVSPDVKTGILPNGLKYYIKYNRKPEKKVELRLAENAGSIMEDESQQGLAHFMEHMNFNGLQHFPHNELVHYLQSIGVSFGNDLNAYTGFDETVYILPVPSDDKEKLDKAFTVLADWSGAALLANDEIENERGVILEESRLGKGADDRMMKKWLPEMLNGSKYSLRLPIGKDSIIEHFDPSRVKDFYHDWYRPNLQAVIVVGDMPVSDAEKMIVDKFGGFKNPDNSKVRPEVFEIKPFTKNKAMVLSDPEADRISISITGSSHPRKAISTVGDYHENMIEGLCFKMLSARFDELKNSATPPFVYAYAYVGGGWARGYENFGSGAMCGADEIQKAVEAIVIESMRVKKFGFTEAELERAKASLLSEYEQRYNERDKTESERFTYEFISYFFQHDAIPGIEWEYNYVKDHIKSIALQDFDAVRSKFDIDDKFFALVTAKTQPNLPGDEQLKGWIEAALKKELQPYKENKIASSLLDKEPVAGKVIRTEKNEKLGTTTYTLSNQVTVCVKPTDFKNDEILLKGSRHGGYSLYAGLDYQSAQWSNNAVDEMGFGSFSNSDLNKFLSGKMVSVSCGIGDYSEDVDANSSVKDLETMFQLLYLKCTAPRRDETAFKSFISRSKQQLESLKQNPQYLFMDSAFNYYYQGNVRAHIIESTSDYDKMNMDHAIEFYKQRICNPAGMYYTIIGSFTEAQIVPLIEKYLGSLVAAPINTQPKDLGLVAKPGSNEFTLKKGTEKQATLIHYISANMPYNPDDNFLLRQLNAVINDKIIDTIREKMSAIYGGGMGGALRKYPREELFIQSDLPCSPDNIEKVHKAFMDLIESTKANGGITDADWLKAREPAIEMNKVNLKKNDFWLNSLQNAYMNGVDPERILTTEKRLMAITPEQLTATARKFFLNTNNFLKAEWLPEK